MKQQVVSSNGHGSSSPSLSPAAARTRAPRASPPPKVKQAPAAPGAKARPRATAVVAGTTMATARRQIAVPARRAMSTKESDKEETAEEEVVRLRGEVEVLRREVQRLLRLNADLQHQQQASHDAASNRPQPPNKIPGGVPARPPPPPPPPPPALPRQQQKQHGPVSTSPVSKATALVDMYNSLQTNSNRQTDRNRSRHHHSSIVDELQNRSRHLLAIKADVETKAEFINDLINKIHTVTYTGVEQVVTFVDWLDQQLSILSDETAVLKHFNWPERKADALREAASEYRHLNCLLTDISSLNLDDGSPTPCEATLRRISSLLDRLEKSMSRLLNLRSSVMSSYRELRIPTDWMLDSGICSKLRLASVTLAKLHMRRVLKELDCRDTAGNEAALVAQSVRFTYRVHQFAGGLDGDATRAFEELRRRVRPISSS
ncbi:hypothetical protein U9M48_034762 [Paspalum notatum var. saurae]|uniref:Protein CHUP1, chloroplastic n=1 Tax=Paspalum notatum var. saurae TaxID=547442 RepID=A0AAQ3U9R0_PASNO